MAVSYDDAIATLEAMFPKWDKGTLGDHFTFVYRILHPYWLQRLQEQFYETTTCPRFYLNFFSSFLDLDVLLQQNDNHIERTIDVIFAIDEDSEPVVPG